MTNTRKTEQIVPNIQTSWADGNVDFIDAQYAPDFVGQYIESDLQYERDDYKRVLDSVQTVVPTLEVTIEELFATDDLIGSRWVVREMPDSDPPEATADPMTKLRYAGVVVSQIQDDVITAEWSYGNLDQLAQLFSDQTEKPTEHSESLFYQLFLHHRMPPGL